VAHNAPAKITRIAGCRDSSTAVFKAVSKPLLHAGQGAGQMKRGRTRIQKIVFAGLNLVHGQLGDDLLLSDSSRFGGS